MVYVLTDAASSATNSVDTEGSAEKNYNSTVGDTTSVTNFGASLIYGLFDVGTNTTRQATAMSRTTFVVHFKTAAGVPPLTYLLNWRMRLAERALRAENVPVSALALSLGYTSDEARSAMPSSEPSEWLPSATGMPRDSALHPVSSFVEPAPPLQRPTAPRSLRRCWSRFRPRT